MAWRVDYTKRFLKELSRLPSEVRARIETVVFTDLPGSQPFDLGSIERMKGYSDKYKIRVGQYRIGLEIDTKNQRILCKRVAHRRDIYRTFP